VPTQISRYIHIDCAFGSVATECYFLDRTDEWYYHFRRARKASILLDSEFRALSEGPFCESRLSRTRQND